MATSTAPETFRHVENYAATHRLEIPREDKRAIFSVAVHAQRVVDFVHNLSSHEETLLEASAGSAEGGRRGGSTNADAHAFDFR